ncbi:MAG TPA: hypothetical protein DEF34_03450 [Desulfotomaculum sp.]|nr:MAG: hypothetical protein JL56_03060 [Desulfotomaculum sp. BICA1-6]HBX22684.1 hypothetical protein [Desulfotomaculum sp.]
MMAYDPALMQALVFLMMLILVDVFLGGAIAIRAGTFSLAELPRFLQTEVLPYYMGVLAVVGLAMVDDVQHFGTVPLAWAVITAYGSKVVFVEIRKKIFILFKVSVEDTPVK